MDALAQLRASLAQARGTGPTGPPGLDAALSAVLETDVPGALDQAYVELCQGANIPNVPRTEGARRAAAKRFAEAYAHSGPAIGRMVQAVKRAEATKRNVLFPGGEPKREDFMRLDLGLLRPCALGAGRSCAVCGSGAHGGQDLQAQLAVFFRDTCQGWNAQFRSSSRVQQDRLEHLRALVQPLMCSCPDRPTVCECSQPLIVTMVGKKLIVNKVRK